METLVYYITIAKFTEFVMLNNFVANYYNVSLMLAIINNTVTSKTLHTLRIFSKGGGTKGKN
jgi:hypothetical protein